MGFIVPRIRPRTYRGTKNALVNGAMLRWTAESIGVGDNSDVLMQVAATDNRGRPSRLVICIGLYRSPLAGGGCTFTR